MCRKHLCVETQYKADGITVVKSTPTPDAAPCNTAEKKRLSEATAKSKLSDAVAAQGESIHPCDADPKCQCAAMPDWPGGAGGWTKINTGLTSTQVVDWPGGCSWSVELKYDRYYRERSARCYVKPIAMLPPVQGEERPRLA